MPACAPESVTNPNERQLYRDLSRLFEDYCGIDTKKYPEREDSFIKIASLAVTTIQSKREPTP